MLLFNEDLDGLENHHQDDLEPHKLNEDITSYTEHDDYALSESGHEKNDSDEQGELHILDQDVDISDIKGQHIEPTGIDEPNVNIGEEDISHIHHKLDKIGGDTHVSFGNDCSCSGNCYSVCVESCASHCSGAYSN